MRADDPLQDFLTSVPSTVPPAGLGAALVGTWHALRGEWQLAHEAVQEHEDDLDCAWVHAALHREEGDLGNARYWYGIAGRRIAQGPARDEYVGIARALLEG